MKAGKREQDDPKSIDIEQFRKMTDEYPDAGFTYFDTAYPYHDETSEDAVRKALVSRYGRDIPDYFGLLNLYAVTGQITNM